MLKEGSNEILQEPMEAELDASLGYEKNQATDFSTYNKRNGLSGFKEAIQAVYPQSAVQYSVIQMLRNSFNYINYNDLKKFVSDFKCTHNAPNEEAVLSQLDGIRDK